MVKKQLPDDNLAKKELPREGDKVVRQDQIVSDLGKMKNAAGKVFGKMKGSLYPKIQENIPTVVNVKSSFFNRFDLSVFKKFGKGFLVFILLLVLFLIGSNIYKTINKGGDEVVLSPTPTIAPFKPYKPSIYAEDELVLKLEEDNRVLERELSTIQLEEVILTPPNLDFDISF